MRVRWSTVALLLPCLQAQEPEPAADARTAVRRWLEARPATEALRDAAVRSVLAEGRTALDHVAGLLRQHEEDEGSSARVKSQALRALVVQVALAFVQRAEDSGMFFAGQYGDLAALQPWVGSLFLNLVFDTPEWYPNDRRTRLVPALRDLFPTSPGRDVVAVARDVADDELEPDDLRRALVWTLAQWDDRELADARLALLRERMASEFDEERRLAQGELAWAYYAMRDYAAAARAQRAYVRQTEELNAARLPVDYYNAACWSALAGDREVAFQELELCVRLMRSRQVDPSVRLKRDLFERDPEMALIRDTKRYRALVDAAFDLARELPEPPPPRRR
ncbi:MAG: hypothetical protein AAF628_06450 [Planctomycetota bacterium]